MTATTTHDDIPSIGRALRSRREQNNISVAEIASKMHLDTRVINALEEDNFNALPDPIYVRGYIRSYSKLVGADADALVKLYELHGGDFEPEIIPEIRHPAQSSSSDRPVQAFTWLIILALVVLLIAWWQSNFVIDTPALTSTAVEPVRQDQAGLSVTRIYSEPQSVPSYTTNNFEESPAIQTSNAGTNLPATMNNNDVPGALPPTTSATTEALTEALTDVTSTDQTIAPVTTMVAERPAGLIGLDSAQPQNIDNTQTVMGPLPAQGVTESTQTTIYQTNGPDLIVLRLTADSWIEIIDANNTKVFFDLGRPGDVFNVRGTAPFDVLLGFAQAVTVEFNGNPFNAAPFSRAGVARFTLGE